MVITSLFLLNRLRKLRYLNKNSASKEEIPRHEPIEVIKERMEEIPNELFPGRKAYRIVLDDECERNTEYP